MFYDNYINEEIYVIYGDSYDHEKSVMRLCEILNEDDINYDTKCLKFKKDDKYIFIDETEILQFLPIKWLNDEEHKFFYVIFRYGKTSRSKEHVYISHDYTIKPGDKILTCCDERAGNVIRTGFFTKHDAPYPIEKTWLIKRKAYDEISLKSYDNYEELICNDNVYFKHKESQTKAGYISKAKCTYRGFTEWYIEDVDKVMRSSHHKITSDNILNYISEEYEGGFNYRNCGYEGDFLVRKNQIYSFFDSVWICYLLAKYGCSDELVFDTFKYMIIIYQNGDFDEYLYNIELDKKQINEHVNFIEKFLNQN